MKILITGAAGVLGSSAVQHFKNHEVLAADRARLDLRDPASILKVASEFRPDVVIHAAAMTDLEKCEVEPKASYQVNTLATQLLVQATCKDDQTLFIYLSSSGIYGATRADGNYTEMDSPAPTTVHHKTKLLGEDAVRGWTRRHLILRTGWLFGGAAGLRKNFVMNRYKEMSGKSVVYSDPAQVGNPTWVNTLVGQIDRLIDSGHCGTFNAVSTGSASRYEYVREIARQFELKCAVEKGTPDQFVRIAPVSKNESAVNQSLDLLGLNLFRPWQEDLKAYIESVKAL